MVEKVLKFLDSNHVLAFSDCQGSCPCGGAYIFGLHIDFHCWRSGCNKSCKFSGLHVSNNCDWNYSQEDLEKIGAKLLKQITEIWSQTDWDLVIEKYKEKDLKASYSKPPPSAIDFDEKTGRSFFSIVPQTYIT